MVSTFGAVLGDVDGVSAKHRADALLPHVAGDRQHHPGLEPVVFACGRECLGHHGRIETQPQPVRNRHRRHRLTGRLIGGEQLAGRAPGRQAAIILSYSVFERPNSLRVEPSAASSGRPGPAHLADVAIRQRARGERDEVARSHVSGGRCAPPRVFPRRHPRGVLGGRRAHPAGGHGLQHRPGQRLLGDARVAIRRRRRRARVRRREAPGPSPRFHRVS